MPTCQQITELITEYLEGQLSLGQRMSFVLHIGMCRHCRGYLRQVRVTVHALGRMPRAPLPPHVRDELLDQFRSWAHS